ncbi:MAG TPA: metal-dependent hydrolase [Oligoflexia bacterium]|nr:metal-dependent hydrolase [Oligoflexia bacterium]HMP48583.1 metal-dependent hydrolase [Oligoflexia bacterium]
MADEKSHISWAFLTGLAVASFGTASLHLHWEIVLLGFILLIIGSILPNVDSTDEGLTGELAGVFGALLPVLFLEKFPILSQGGTVRIALTLLFGFILARTVFSYLTNNLFSPRGALHSIPAVILFFEIGYLLFPDLSPRQRLFLGTCLGMGVLSHLLLDAFTNIKLVKNTVAKNAHSGAVLKFTGVTSAATWFVYIMIIFLGWFVAQDLKPSLRVQPPVTTEGSAK